MVSRHGLSMNVDVFCSLEGNIIKNCMGLDVSCDGLEGNRSKNGTLKHFIHEERHEHVIASTQTRAKSCTKWQGIISLLQKCVTHSEGEVLHSHVRRLGLEQDTFLANLLVSMYGRLRALDDARHVFNGLRHRDVVSWNAIITAYVRQGHHKEALQLFMTMQQENFIPNRVTYLSALSACGNTEVPRKGKEVHVGLINNGFELDVTVGTAVVSMYGKLGDVDAAMSTFVRSHQHNLICWTAMIMAYAQRCCGKEALQLFWRLEQESINPDEVTLVTALSACSMLAALRDGQLIHICIIHRNLESKLVVGNALLHMYGKCEALNEALFVFDTMNQRDVVSWTAIIASCANHGHNKEAFQMYKQMQFEGVKPNKVTFVSILSACAGLKAMAEGALIHACVAEMGFEQDAIIGTALVNLYGKGGAMEDACVAFDTIQQRNVVAWNAMLTVFVEQEYCEEAIELFQHMQRQCMRPDDVTFIGILSACGSVGALVEGVFIHTWVVGSKLESNVVVMTALITMYGKCGAMDDAVSIFNKICRQDVASLNAIIAAYSQQGHAKSAIHVFLQMSEEKTKPNTATFTSLLSACSHAGLVDEGYSCFASMSEDYGFSPTVEHHACMIDLIGRVGCLDEAENFLDGMPLQPNAFVLMALLSACKMHGDMKRGKSVAKCAIDLDPQCTAPYVILSSIYAAEDRWDDAVSIGNEMIESFSMK